MAEIKRMEEDFDFFWDKIQKGDNLVFLRYGDGERMLMNGEKVLAQEGWKAPDGLTEVGKQLWETLDLTDSDVYYAISCPCCDPEAYLWYLKRLNTSNVTFANLWVNANYEKFVSCFETLVRDAVVIANYRAEGKRIGNLNVVKQYSISDDCIGFWEREGDTFLNRILADTANMQNTLFVVSAGPLSEIIIYHLYHNNPGNCYVDFGSSLDKYIHNKITRPYMRADRREATQYCWMIKNPEEELDVDVVLTAYKRPETLKLQIDAVLGQSLKPKNLYLFQDGIDSYYRIELDDEIKKYFKKVEVADKNYGVWERFAFAARVSDAKYVCIFDDDTIPGRRWLENCLVQMQREEGIYGTNGILLSELDTYPIGKEDRRIGWSNPNHETVEVDFVGHSWFLKREWIPYMFEVGDVCKEQFKCVGEDMCLSYGALLHGIRTFVPPHPLGISDLWGSLPKYARKFGISSGAISLNSTQHTRMNAILQLLRKEGWENIHDRDYGYYKKIAEEYDGEKEGAVNKLLDAFNRLCIEKENIYIYGAGNYASIIWGFLQQKGIKPKGFVVTKKDGRHEQYKDLPIMNVETFLARENRRFLILGLDAFYHDEIRDKFSGREDVEVYPRENDNFYDRLVKSMELYN